MANNPMSTGDTGAGRQQTYWGPEQGGTDELGPEQGGTDILGARAGRHPG